MAKKATKKRGRKSKFTQKLADTICEQLMEGRSLRAICSAKGMPTLATVFNWLHSRKDFFEQYVRARDVQADVLADETIHIADTPKRGKVVTVGPKGTEVKTADMLEHRRLQIETRKWFAGQVAPKRYGKGAQQPDAPASNGKVPADGRTDEELLAVALGGGSGASEAPASGPSTSDALLKVARRTDTGESPGSPEEQDPGPS